MADNITLKDGNNASFVAAADDISSVFYSRQKIVFGADGSATDVSSTSPLPVENKGAPLTAITVTASLDTSAYASGDVLFDTQEIASAARAAGSAAKLVSVEVLDKDDQGVEMDLVFFNAATSLGTANSAPDITETEAEDVLGIVNIPAANYVDLGAAKVATVPDLNLILQTDASSSLYFAGISRGTPTHTDGGLIFMLGFEQG